MYTVSNNKQLGVAYILLRYYEAGLKGAGRDKALIAENAKEVKKAIREYVGKPASESRIVKDYGIDGCIVKFPLPEGIGTVEEAEEYFLSHHYIEATNSPYDCTGKAFTSWYRIIQIRGRFYAYHSVGFDV